MLDGEEWNLRMNCVAEEDTERLGKENKRLPEEAAILNLVNSKKRRNHTNTLPAALRGIPPVKQTPPRLGRHFEAFKSL